MKGELVILILCAAMAFILGNGYYQSFRSGVLTIIKTGRTYRREEEPIRYWIGMAAGTFAFLVVLFGTAIMAFAVWMNLFGTSN